ncbi:MAG TPA: hypothetical protein DCP91_02120, partial [Eggerthellaceae bacterium]|nr:hypothetical protein [Eggerthellaceae bacterium]
MNTGTWHRYSQERADLRIEQAGDLGVQVADEARDVLDLDGFLAAVAASAGRPDGLGERADVGPGHRGGAAVIGEDGARRGGVLVEEEPRQLGEDAVGHRGEPVLQRRALAHQMVAVARELLDSLGVLGRHA